MDSLLQLPDGVIAQVLQQLDARSLVALQQTCSYFSRREPATRLPLVEHVARAQVQQLCGSLQDAARFRHRSWRERLYLEQSTGVGFDRAFCEEGGFRFQFNTDGGPLAVQGVRLVGMGPKLLLSDQSTAQQPVLRWKLGVKGNTAVEFGIVPADCEPSHTSLHKCPTSPPSAEGHQQQQQQEQQHHRAMGFCSQITAGSLLPLKAPVMRGTVLDIVARRGRLEVVLQYPPGATEISWQAGQPVQRPYRGPSQLRFEQDFPADYDVRLAVTAWAKANFEVLHTGPASGLQPAEEWAASAAAADAAAAAASAEALLLVAGDESAGAEAGIDTVAAAAAAATAAAAAAAAAATAAVQHAAEQVAAAAAASAEAAAADLQRQQQLLQLAVGEAAREKAAAAWSLPSGSEPAAGMAAKAAAAPAAEQGDASDDAGGALLAPLPDNLLALTSGGGAGASLPASGPLLRQLHSLQSVLGLFHRQQEQQHPLQRPAESAAALLADSSQHHPLPASRVFRAAAAPEADTASSSGEPSLPPLLPLRSSPSLELSQDGHRLDFGLIDLGRDIGGGGSSGAVSPHRRSHEGRC